MKWLHSYCLRPLLIWQTCIVKQIAPDTDTKSEQVIKDTVHFSSQIQPVLVKNCSPCHFTGGKMYERLPFDKDTTIINHSAAILKRIKNKEENALLSNFINQNKNGPPESKPDR
jgi:hypothetical protein